MGKTKNQNDINYDVANALYLMTSTLGENYEKEHISPFMEDFVLTKELAEKIINNNKELNKMVGRAFLENGNLEVAEKLKNSLKATADIIENLQNKIQNGEFENENIKNVKTEINNVITLLLARKKMLEIAIEKLKNNRENSLNLYKDILSTSKRIEELLENSYEEKIKLEEVTINLIELARKEAKMQQLKASQINNLQEEVNKKIQENNEKLKKEIEEKNQQKNTENKTNKSTIINEKNDELLI